MDNLEKYLKDKEDKYHYTGFTDEAITKTQNIGYQNNYFTLLLVPRNYEIIENILNL